MGGRVGGGGGGEQLRSVLMSLNVTRSAAGLPAQFVAFKDSIFCCDFVLQGR